mgnify:CR=1 FL=1
MPFPPQLRRRPSLVGRRSSTAAPADRCALPRHVACAVTGERCPGPCRLSGVPGCGIGDQGSGIGDGDRGGWVGDGEREPCQAVEPCPTFAKVSKVSMFGSESSVSNVSRFRTCVKVPTVGIRWSTRPRRNSKTKVMMVYKENTFFLLCPTHKT